MPEQSGVVELRFNKTDQPDFFKVLNRRVNQYFRDRGRSRKANFNMVAKTLLMLGLYFVPFVVMLIVLPMKTGSYPTRIMYFLNGHALWKIFTVLTQRTLMRTSYLLDASRLPRTWLCFCGSVNHPDKATESIGILMTGMMNCLNSQKNPCLLRKILWYVQQMSASFVVVYLIVQHQILLHINFLPSERILFIATSLNLIWSMHMTGLAAIGKPAATCPSSVKSLNSWPTLPRCTHMTSKSNYVISLKVHGLLAALSHPLTAQRCHQNATVNHKLRLQPLSALK